MQSTEAIEKGMITKKNSGTELTQKKNKNKKKNNQHYIMVTCSCEVLC